MTRWAATCCGWIVRHGESTGNVGRLVQGQSLDAPLTARGHAQAAAIATSVPRELRPRLVSSDLLRARQTAAALSARTGAAARFTPALRERRLGVLEGMSWSGVDPAVIGVRDGVVVDPDATPEGGESVRQFVDRVLGALTALATAHGSVPVIVVAHGGVARTVAAMTAAADLPRSGDPLVGLPWPSIEHTRPLPCCFADLALRTDVLCRIA